MSTFDTNRFKRTAGTFNAFGRTKAPIQIGASGVDANFTPRLTATEYNHTRTFTGLTPGVQVVLVDRLFSVETGDAYLAHVVKSGQVDKFGQITFDRLRDSLYSLIVVDIEYAHESRHDIVIGNPSKFDTLVKHAIPSAPYIYETSYADIGYSTSVTLAWRLGNDGIAGFPEIHYTVSGAGEWVLFNRYDNRNLFSATVQPLSFDTAYQFKMRLVNEDFLPGPWSNTVVVNTSDLTVSGTSSSGVNNYSQLLLHLDFEDTGNLYKDKSGRNHTLTGGNPDDYTTDNSIYGIASYNNSSGLSALTVDHSDFYLSASDPYTSFVVEGTYKISGGISLSTSYGLVGGNSDQGLSLQLITHPSIDYVSTVRFGYGDGMLVDITVPTDGKRATWPLGQAKHVVAVWDASNTDVFFAKLYIDGLLVGSGTSAYGGTIGENVPFTVFNHYAISGFIGSADEVKVWKWVGNIAPDDSDAHIKASVPAPGVFNTGYNYPRLNIDSQATEESSNPVMSVHNANSGLFWELTSSGLKMDPDTATSGYAWVCDDNGYGSWQQVSGTGGGDHGALTGLADDDHTQYHNDTRGDARYYQQSEFISSFTGNPNEPILTDSDGFLDGGIIKDSAIDHGEIGGLTDDDHTQYSLADGSRNFTGDVTIAPENSGTISIGNTTGNQAYGANLDLLSNTDNKYGEASSEGFRLSYNSASNIFELWSTEGATLHRKLKIYRDLAGGSSQWYTRVAGLDPTASNDFTTKSYVDGEIVAISGVINDNIVALSGQALMHNGSQPLTGDLDANNEIIYFTEYDNGNTGAALDIKWDSNGHKQKITLNDSPTITFTDPPGACNLLLKVNQDATGNRDIDWSGNFRWPGGSKPTLTSSGSAMDIVTFYFDGTNYYGVASLAFE